MQPLGPALMITAIGMGLVFLAILLLWGMMELMVRWGADKTKAEEEVEAVVEAPVLEAVPAVDSSRLKHLAAAAAVALALAQRGGRNGHVRVEAETDGFGSPWQAVQRSARLNQRNNMYSRKQRGGVR